MAVSGVTQQQHAPEVPARLRIGLFGPYSSKNLGDTATQMAVMDNIRRRYPAVEFIGICFDPADAARTHRITSADMTGRSSHLMTVDKLGNDYGRTVGGEGGRLRRYMPAIFSGALERLAALLNIARIVGKIDMLVISGGGQLDDFWGGPWRRPYELLVWSLIGRVQNRKVAVFATGLDNLTTKTGFLLVLWAMRLAHYRTFRDPETLSVLRKAGFRQPSSVSPDPAFSLAEDPSWGQNRPHNGRRVVLVCPIAESAWRRGTDASYQNYIDALTETCVRLIGAGKEVHLSNSQTAMDVPIVELLATRVRERIDADSGMLHIKLASTVHDFCTIASNADVVIASRLHGVILPLVTGTPVVAVAYMRKVSLLMTDVGMPDKCLELTMVSAERLTELTLETLASADAIRERIRQLNVGFRSTLSAAYADMLRAAGVATAAIS